MSIGLCEREETVELLLKSGVVCSYSVIWLGSFGFSRSFLIFVTLFFIGGIDRCSILIKSGSLLI